MTALQGSDFIVHAGDIGDAASSADLARIAPVTAVRGNNDIGDWASVLPHTATLEAARVRIHVIHDIAQLAVDPKSARFDVVVAGHAHRPAIRERDGVLYVNPGSAGPRRFSLPISLGELSIVDGGIRPLLKTLRVATAA